MPTNKEHTLTFWSNMDMVGHYLSELMSDMQEHKMVDIIEYIKQATGGKDYMGGPLTTSIVDGSVRRIIEDNALKYGFSRRGVVKAHERGPMQETPLDPFCDRILNRLYKVEAEVRTCVGKSMSAKVPLDTMLCFKDACIKILNQLEQTAETVQAFKEGRYAELRQGNEPSQEQESDSPEQIQEQGLTMGGM